MASKAPINAAYRQRKPAAATGRTGTGKPTPAINAKPVTTVSRLDKDKAPVAAAAAPATVAAQAASADAEEANRKLRAFDLDARYGPCLGMTRLERWERAHANGLNPPAEVKALVEGSSDPARKENLWHEFKEVL